MSSWPQDRASQEETTHLLISAACSSCCTEGQDHPKRRHLEDSTPLLPGPEAKGWAEGQAPLSTYTLGQCTPKTCRSRAQGQMTSHQKLVVGVQDRGWGATWTKISNPWH